MTSENKGQHRYEITLHSLEMTKTEILTAKVYSMINDKFNEKHKFLIQTHYTTTSLSLSHFVWLRLISSTFTATWTQSPLWEGLLWLA